MPVGVLDPALDRRAGLTVLQHAFGADQVEQVGRGPLEGLRREELGHGALDDGQLSLHGAGREPIAEQAADLDVDGDARQAVAGNRVVDLAAIARPREGALEEAAGLAVGGRLALEGERHRHHVPATVDLTDTGGVGHPHVVVERHVGALSAKGVHGPHLDAG